LCTRRAKSRRPAYCLPCLLDAFDGLYGCENKERKRCVTHSKPFFFSSFKKRVSLQL
jgi:hypothetical protein